MDKLVFHPQIKGKIERRFRESYRECQAIGKLTVNETTLDVFNAIQQCPIWKGDDANEIGEDCAGCARVDPDRAAVCKHVFEYGDIEITPDLMVIIPEGK